MCSVRHRPMPSAPRSRAFVDWSGVSALARTRNRRRSSAIVINRSNERHSGSCRAASSPCRAFSSSDSWSGQFAHEDVAAEPVDRDDVALAHGGAVRGELPVGHPELDRVGAAHRRDALAARHHGRVRVRPAGARQDALGRDHAVVVVRRGLATDQDDPLPRLASRLRLVGGEHHRAGGRARRCVEAGRDRLGAGRIDPPLEQLLQSVGVDAQQRLAFVDQVLVEHLVGHDPFAERGALAHPRLQDPQPALLDRELDVAHVAVVALERGHHLAQARVGRRRRPSPGRRAAACCGCPPRRPRPARCPGSRRRAPSRRCWGRA